MIEEFLKLVEPKYPIALEELRSGQISAESIFVISGFVAAITSCAPAAIRLNTSRTRGVLHETAREMDDEGVMPPSPESLGGKSLSELLSDGTVGFNIDEKFPQAVAIAGVLPKASALGNADWELFRNNGFSPYFTSDFPVGVQWRGRVFSRIVPLAPDLALRITCDWRPRGVIDLDFSRNRTALIEASKRDVVEINEVVVRSAEETVFFRDNDGWVDRFVSKHRHYRLENTNIATDDDEGRILTSVVRIMPRIDR